MWKVIVDFPIYEVNEQGEVRHVGTKHLKKPFVNEKGYLKMSLFQYGIRKHVRVHRLVAETFIPNPDNKPQVNHKDGNKRNNHVTNLEWVTNEENHIHKIENGLQHRKFVVQYSKNGEYIKEFKSLTEAAKSVNRNQYCISLCCRGKLKSSGGYVWRWKDATDHA